MVFTGNANPDLARRVVRQLKKTELQRAAVAVDQLNTQRGYRALLSDIQPKLRPAHRLIRYREVWLIAVGFAAVETDLAHRDCQG